MLFRLQLTTEPCQSRSQTQVRFLTWVTGFTTPIFETSWKIELRRGFPHSQPSLGMMAVLCYELVSKLHINPSWILLFVSDSPQMGFARGFFELIACLFIKINTTLSLSELDMLVLKLRWLRHGWAVPHFC